MCIKILLCGRVDTDREEYWNSYSTLEYYLGSGTFIGASPPEWVGASLHIDIKWDLVVFMGKKKRIMWKVISIEYGVMGLMKLLLPTQ
jgi:hypothetical protein